MKMDEKIKRLRAEYDMTQLELAKIAGVSDKAVSTWERGTKEPRIKPLQRLCAHFGMDINAFADTSNDIYNAPTPVSESGPKYPKNYDKLNDANKAIVDRLIADLAKNQSEH